MRSNWLYGRDDSSTETSMEWVKIFLVGTYLEVQAVLRHNKSGNIDQYYTCTEEGNDSDYRAQEI